MKRVRREVQNLLHNFIVNWHLNLARLDHSTKQFISMLWCGCNFHLQELYATTLSLMLHTHNVTVTYIDNITYCNKPNIIIVYLDSPEYQLMIDIIDQPRRIKDIRQLSGCGQTSSLESFHSVVNHYAPKMIHFQYKAMYTRYSLRTFYLASRAFWLVPSLQYPHHVYCNFSTCFDQHCFNFGYILFWANFRLRLAAIHFNHNSTTQESDRRAVIIYPKAKKGEATARNIYSRKQDWSKYDQCCNTWSWFIDLAYKQADKFLIALWYY